MPGGRKTHTFPRGVPFPIVLLTIAIVIVIVLWVSFASKGWLYALPIIAIFSAIAFVYFKVLDVYERTGRAVRIARPSVRIQFVDGTPGSILALRYSFVVIVATMLVSGLVPVTQQAAKPIIIACVLGLFLIAILHVILEYYYLNIG